ncbi:MAG: hypothetical protein ABIJ92_03890 [Candidatus Aenigmatarchaeota archaeon]
MTEKNKIMATVRIGKPIDTDTVLKDMEKESKFSDVKYSPSLGLIKFKHGEKTVLLFSSGKIVIRKAVNEKDAVETVKVLSEIMKF